jgi:hypothetical protein
MNCCFGIIRESSVLPLFTNFKILVDLLSLKLA